MSKRTWALTLTAVLGLSILLTACVAGTVPGDGAAADTSGAAAAVTPAQTDGTPTTSLGNMSTVSTMVIDRGLDEIGRACIDCHKEIQPGIIHDWRESRHGHVGVSCLDCHQVDKNSPMATQHENLIGTDIYMSALVPAATCGRCHVNEVDQFNASGHFRAYRQQIPKDSLHALVFKHEGQENSEFGSAPNETGCIQCHGTEIQLDEENRPTSHTWPNSGVGNVYPDGSTGSCAVCHTRHKFSIAEARQPAACASCHLGPDHPDIEIYENSKHGQIYAIEGDEWNWDAAPDAWEPGDYRAPTCATCHMSGIGELQTTHNVSERLYWNLWAERSEVRNSNDPMSPLLGDGEAGREMMKQVCQACHSELHTDNFFEQGDRAVNLYNVAYYDEAKKMLDELGEKGLLEENPWTDDFQLVYYHLWHHEGRRARQGSLMAGPDWAHWHGFFELQQDLYELEDIYNRRIETGQID
ncbi:MAG: multiheme c-type cytochrome [Caldilineaceae bacterium]